MANEMPFETAEQKEKAILVFLPEARSTWEETDLYEELKELSDTAGLEVVDYLVQHRASPDTAYFLGRGKLEELRGLALAKEADCVVFDHTLSPSQLHNLSRALDLKVIDKTMLILDIFAQRARSREGKLQVELAQSTYLLPRLTGQGINLSRQGGMGKGNGVGTRGPGETKLEMDKRRIRQRISAIKHELKEVRKHRDVQQKSKLRHGIPLITLVGYTNAGKSSLLNALTEDEIYVEDQLFATLDPTTRSFYLPNGTKALLTDTVGFIHDLPPQLIEAFKATLDELQYADLLVHVIDCSNPNFENQLEAVDEILAGMDLKDKPRMYVFNKIDRLEDLPVSSIHLDRDASVYVSAAKGTNLERLKEKMQNMIRKTVTRSFAIPLTEGRLLNLAYEAGQVKDLEYTETAACFVWTGDEKNIPRPLMPYQKQNENE